MKNMILFAAGIVSIGLFVMRAGADIPLQTISLSGTVEVQNTFTPTTSRTRVSLLNAKRVFDEFSVSGTNYALVCDLNGSNVVKLMPKSASSGLPTIEVFSLTENAAVIHTKLAFSDFYANLTSTALGNLFEGLAGAVKGRVSFEGTIGSGGVKAFSFSGLALGKNQNSAINSAALLKIKIVATGEFKQEP